MFKKETQEQKDAREAVRLAEAEGQALRDAQAARERAEASRLKELKKFMASSPGRARSAFDRGDHIYQLVLDVKPEATPQLPQRSFARLNRAGTFFEGLERRPPRVPRDVVDTLP